MLALAAIDISSTTPCWRRSSGTYPMPRRMACAGEVMRTACPWSRISPESAGDSPNRISASWVRPEPTSPASPRISPRRTENETSRIPLRRCVTWRASSATSPSSTRRFGKTAASSRPTIRRMSSPRSTVAAARVATVSPSRSTVMRSAIAAISSSRCEM